MSYISLDAVKYGDSMSMDAFARLRVSGVSTIFDSRSQYNLSPRDWSTLVSGTGVVTHLSNEGTVQLGTGGTANGASAIRQTKLCWRYDPGKSQLVFTSFQFGADEANVRRRIGYYDLGNGLFLEQSSGSLKIVLRSSVTGAAVDVPIPQSSWNVDRLDGSGPSGITLDVTKIQLMFFDFQGLGAGRVRFGFFFDGRPVVAHALSNSNVASVVATTTVNLPVRAEIQNTGVAASAATLKMVASSVLSEEGADQFGIGKLNSAANGTAPVSVTGRRPVLSVRPALNFNGVPNRAWYMLIESVLKVGTNDIFWEIVFGATLTGASWAAASPDSSVEFDVAATALAGGISLVKGYALSGQGATSGQSIAEVSGRFPNSVDSLLNTQGPHTLVATAMTGTATVAAAMNWREIY